MTESELKELQKVILEMAIDFDVFCLENNITYYLMGGSALGAMRHKGFIPWDDDFDVFMDSDNYFKFIKIVKIRLNTDKYYFQEENTKEWPLFFSKIRMNNTTFIERDVVDSVMHHGIYIDIMCLNNAFENKFFRFFQYLSARLLSASVLGRRGYNTKSFFKKVAVKISKIVVLGFINSLLLKFVRSQNMKRSELVGHFFGRAPFLKTTFPVHFLSKPRYTHFESVSLPVPKEVEKYLEVRYGNNYMELPSKEEMDKYPSHAYIVDTKISYKKYMNDSF